MTKKITLTPTPGEDPDLWLAEARALALQYKRAGKIDRMNLTDFFRFLLDQAKAENRAWLDSQAGKDAVKAELERL